MATKGDYRISGENGVQPVESFPRRHGVMFSPSSSRSRLGTVDSGKRYEFRLIDDGTVEFRAESGPWQTIQPLPEQCGAVVPPAFISYDTSRAGTALDPVRFDMIAIGRGRILAKEAGTDRLFHLVMDELFRTHRVVSDDCKLYADDPKRCEDPAVPAGYWKLDPEFFVTGPGTPPVPAALERNYSRHPASLRFPAFREVLRLEQADAMLVLQQPRVWYLIDARSPLMITGPDDLRITEPAFKAFFSEPSGLVRIVDILSAAYATTKVKVEEQLRIMLDQLIGAFWTPGRIRVAGALVGAGLGGIIGAFAGFAIGGPVGALGASVLGAIGGAIIGGIVVPFILENFIPWIINRIVDGLAGLVINAIAPRIQSSIQLEGFGALVLPANCGLLLALYKLREGLPGQRALDTVDGSLALHPGKALAKMTESFPDNQPLSDALSALMQQARGGDPIPNSPPAGVPTFVHLRYVRNSDGDEQPRVSIQFGQVLDLGVGYSHWSEHWQLGFGTELNNLAATRPIAQQERYNLLQYRLLNGPVLDTDGFNDGTCNFYMLVRLGKRHDTGGAYAILWMDEQSYISQRWRLLHPTDDVRGDWFSLGRVLTDNARDGEDWFRFDPTRYWSPFAAGAIDDRSRMRVRRQLIAVTGFDQPSQRHEIYTICFNYGVCDHTWRWRRFPEDAVQRLLGQQEAGAIPGDLVPPFALDQHSDAYVYVNSLELRDDLTLHVRGFRRIASMSTSLVQGRWFQSYLPSDAAHTPRPNQLQAGVKPPGSADHPWHFITEEAFQRGDQFYQFGAYQKTIDSRCQYYEVDLLPDGDAPGPSIDAVSDRVWRNDRDVDPVDPLSMNTQNVNLSFRVESSGYIPLTRANLLEDRRTLQSISMYEPTLRLRLLARRPMGLIAVFADKRDDELQPISHLPREATLVLEPLSKTPDCYNDGPSDPLPSPLIQPLPIQPSPTTSSTLPTPHRIRVLLRAHRSVLRPPVVRDVLVTRELSAGATSGIRIRFWTRLTSHEIHENIFRVHLAALDATGVVKILEVVTFNEFARLDAPQRPLPLYHRGPLHDEYCYEYARRNIGPAAEAAIDRCCTPDGRLSYATSVWFEDVVGHVATADSIRFGAVSV